MLKALPTRDAVLPLLCALYCSAETGCALVDLFAQFPPRFSKAGLIDRFPQEASRAIVRRFSPEDERIKQVDFEGDLIKLLFDDGHREAAADAVARRQRTIRQALGTFFTGQLGFDEIMRINTIDGVRITFGNGDIAHIRPSGNAPQLRIYAVADTQRRADEIVKTSLREPDGVLRRMQTAIQG
jgi:phosphomannomutase